jgi:hypothetical protein
MILDIEHAKPALALHRFAMKTTQRPVANKAAPAMGPPTQTANPPHGSGSCEFPNQGRSGRRRCGRGKSSESTNPPNRRSVYSNVQNCLGLHNARSINARHALRQLEGAKWVYRL